MTGPVQSTAALTAAGGFPEDAVRRRARIGRAAAFPEEAGYGSTLLGAEPRPADADGDALSTIRLVPPVFMPQRLEKLIELGREPLYGDVDLATDIGGLRSSLPVYLSAYGSTRAAGTGQVLGASRQAGRLGIPMVIGENVVPMSGYGRGGETTRRTVLDRISAYQEELPDGLGGIAVQQSTEDADAEVWNLVYSDPAARALLDGDRLAFELKVGQGAKPGHGGMTVLGRAAATAVDEQFAFDEIYGPDSDRVLRCASPGTFTEEILRQQIRFMRNNYPRVKVWVKLHPGRDVAHAAATAWSAGADSVTVDGAEGGTGWAPVSLIEQAGLPLGECLARLGGGLGPRDCLLVSGRMWEGGRAVKALAHGARAVGLGRAALIAVDEDPDRGLVRLVDCLALEMRLLISALGKYTAGAPGPEDLWPMPFAPRPPRLGQAQTGAAQLGASQIAASQIGALPEAVAGRG